MNGPRHEVEITLAEYRADARAAIQTARAVGSVVVVDRHGRRRFVICSARERLKAAP